MKLRNVSILVAGAVLLALCIVTRSVLFYAATVVTVFIVYLDFCRLWKHSTNIRKLGVTNDLLARKIFLGSSVKLVNRLKNNARSGVTFDVLQPLEADIDASEPLAQHLRLRPGQETELAHTLKPSRCGRFVVRPPTLTVNTWFFTDSVTAGKEFTIEVLMGVISNGVYTRQVPRGDRQKDDLLISHVERSSEGTDFSSLRNYAPGDNLRNIDWARSSKADKLIVREFERERKPPSFFLLDVDASMGTGSPSERQAAANLTASLVNRLLADSVGVGIISFSRDDLVDFLPVRTSGDHVVRIREILSSIGQVGSEKSPVTVNLTINEAVRLKASMLKTGGMEVLGSVLEETVADYHANIIADGFSKAVAKLVRSSSSPCQAIVLTNLSMGVGSLVNGIRVAMYYGHMVTVVLTPHVWFDDREGPQEEFYARYRELQDAIRKIRRTGDVRVIDLSSGGNPEVSRLTMKVR